MVELSKVWGLVAQRHVEGLALPVSLLFAVSTYTALNMTSYSCDSLTSIRSGVKHLKVHHNLQQRKNTLDLTHLSRVT